MGSSTLDDLRGRVKGTVIASSDPGYDDARKVHNGMIDRKPLAVVQCAGTPDVVAAVNYAREAGLDLSVRGGGHSVPGFGTNDGGIVIDLSKMTAVTVDPAARTARAQGGCTWGVFNDATHKHGLATTGGVVSTTGIGGLTLGGGIGYLTRAFGLSCDNLISAEVVTADGKVLTASVKENDDLFWALRGGGGNFGVVTTFEYQLHPVENIYGGPMFFEIDKVRDVFTAYREIIAGAPRELGAFPAFQIAPPLPFIPENRHGDTLVAIVGMWAGDVAKGPDAFKAFHDIAPVVAEHVDVMPYPALNAAFDPLLPPGQQHYWKANFVKELTDEAIEAHAEHGPKVPFVSSTMHLYPISGAVHDVMPDETAFAYRDANFATVIAGMWDDPADNVKNTQWVKDYYAATAPLSEEGGYINFMAGDDQGRIKANYKDNYARLTQIKKAYDPGNLFHMNQNIKPA
ncbi:MAG TPA: FAD-binding oxidoreductase [Actinomycetota bacterium]